MTSFALQYICTYMTFKGIPYFSECPYENDVTSLISSVVYTEIFHCHTYLRSIIAQFDIFHIGVGILFPILIYKMTSIGQKLLSPCISLSQLQYYQMHLQVLLPVKVPNSPPTYIIYNLLTVLLLKCLYAKQKNKSSSNWTHTRYFASCPMNPVEDLLKELTRITFVQDIRI